MMSWHQSLRVLDANVFMASHNGPYAPNLCPGFWDCLSYYCRTGQVASIDRVRREITGPPELVQWVGQAPDGLFAVSAEPAVVAVFGKMMNWVQQNPQFFDAAKAEFAEVADGWLAAYARVRNAVVVTNEVFEPEIKKRVKLPNVCRQFGVRYQDTYAMLSDLNVQFEWKRCPPTPPNAA